MRASDVRTRARWGLEARRRGADPSSRSIPLRGDHATREGAAMRVQGIVDGASTGAAGTASDAGPDDWAPVGGSARKEAAFNEVLNAAKSSNGYRLLVLNTNDRPLAMKVRSQLLENFPEQKVYMGFQPPFIKLKFGNFLTKEDAEAYKKDILKLKIISGNVYLLPETIELKPDKNKDKETIEN